MSKWNTKYSNATQTWCWKCTRCKTLIFLCGRSDRLLPHSFPVRYSPVFLHSPPFPSFSRCGHPRLRWWIKNEWRGKHGTSCSMSMWKDQLQELDLSPCLTIPVCLFRSFCTWSRVNSNVDKCCTSKVAEIRSLVAQTRFCWSNYWLTKNTKLLNTNGISQEVSPFTPKKENWLCGVLGIDVPLLRLLLSLCQHEPRKTKKKSMLKTKLP